MKTSHVNLALLPSLSLVVLSLVVLSLAALSLAALSFVSPPFAHAQPANKTPFKTDGAFFALSVADLGTSARWYEEKLGLAIVMRVPLQNGIGVTVLEGGGLTVELVQNDQARPPAGDPQLVHGYFKSGFVVKDLERTLAVLRERGVEVAFGPFPASDTQRANVILRDNAGNLIQLFGR
jgi:catechol 2,3-dioxygenase-like lactoylglutathione lyase family enzyme